MHSPIQAAMNSVNSQGSFRQWPAIATEAAAPTRLPKMRPMLLLITPPMVGKLTTAAEVSAQ
ncbi:Uncharacterised protein [Acinetobacter baumannii]|nr:Uncharacterised protein [Acinetobacter baumannii]